MSPDTVEFAVRFCVRLMRSRRASCCLTHLADCDGLLCAADSTIELAVNIDSWPHTFASVLIKIAGYFSHWLWLGVCVCVCLCDFAAFAILHPNEPLLSCLPWYVCVCVHFRGQIGCFEALRLVLHVTVIAALNV